MTDLGSFSNVASSAKVQGVPFIFYDGTNYGAPAWSAAPQNYASYTGWHGTNNTISSVRKLPNATLRKGVVLFSGASLAGTTATLTVNATTLPFNPGSLVVLNKLWQFFTATQYAGNPYLVTSFGGPHQDGFHPDAASWGGSGITPQSVRYQDDSAIDSTTGKPTPCAILLYESADFSGRGVMLH